LERGFIAIAVVAIGWFYYWTVNPEDTRPVLSKKGPGYYNLLTRGFLKGHTALDMLVDPALLLMKRPL
jgi:hypothetical protein